MRSILRYQKISVIPCVLPFLVLASTQVFGGGASSSSGQTLDINKLDAELTVVQNRVRDISGRLEFANKTYVLPDQKRDSAYYERRLEMAGVLIGMKDFQSATAVLYDLVDSEDFKAMPSFYSAMDQLAACLFELKDYFGASGYYAELVSKGGGRYFQSSIVKLIDIASLTGNYRELENYITKLKQTANKGMLSEVYYTLGRSLYKRGDVTRALEVFGNVNSDSKFFKQARYYIGTILVKKDKFAEALEVFNGIASMKPGTEDDMRIYYLANIAAGRLLFEAGKLSEAVEKYLCVDRKSQYFDEALYEIAWIYVKQDQFVKALRTLDIMLIPAGDNQVLAKARILRANLLLKMDRYDEAEAAFADIAKRYGVLKEELKVLVDRRDDPRSYFDQVAGDGLDKIEARKALPEIVVKWTTTDKEVSKSLGVVKVIDVNRQDILDAIKIADKLLFALQGENKLVMFPVLQEAKLKGSQVKMELDAIRKALSAIEDSVIMSVTTQPEMAEIAKIRNKREMLEKQVEAMPKTQEEYRIRTDGVAGRIREMEALVFEMGLEIESLKGQLATVDKWYYETKASRVDEPGEDKLFHERIKKEWATLEQFSVDQKDVMKKIDHEKTLLGLVSDVSMDEKVRSAYREALDNEKLTLIKYRERLTGPATQLLARIDNLNTGVKSIYGKLEQFDININTRVTEKAKDERERIQVEKKVLESCISENEYIESESKTLVGKIVYNGFRRTYRQFFDLVLQSDVGMIDTVWDREETDTKKLQSLQTDLSNEVKAINEQAGITK